MALETMVYPQQAQGHISCYGRWDSPSSYALPWSSLSWCDTAGAEETWAGEWDPSLLASFVQDADEWGWEDVGSDDAFSPASAAAGAPPPPPAAVVQQAATATTAKRKRSRAKMVKNEEEMESQRMNHIAVERNRRRQMNEYLAALRSLMPASYAQRSDQASVVGGAINYVRELEHRLQSLEVRKRLMDSKAHEDDGGSSSSSPFAAFFNFPQYSTSSSSSTSHESCHRIPSTESTGATADIEATVVEGYASLKVQVRRRPRRLLRLTAGLQQLGLTTLHLSVSTAGSTAMYSFSLKLEEECKLTAAEEIAAAVHEILRKDTGGAGFC